MKNFVLAGALCCLTSVAQAQTCHVPEFSALNDQTFDGYMTVKAGRRCSVVRQNSSGPMTARIVSPPAYGTTSVSGSHITYASRPGYAGQDRFTFQDSGQDRYGRPTVRTINVHVRVVP